MNEPMSTERLMIAKGRSDEAHRRMGLGLNVSPEHALFAELYGEVERLRTISDLLIENSLKLAIKSMNSQAPE